MLDSPLPSLTGVWARHRFAADFYKGSAPLWWYHWVHLAWGLLHAWAICPLLRTVNWLSTARRRHRRRVRDHRRQAGNTP